MTQWDKDYKITIVRILIKYLNFCKQNLKKITFILIFDDILFYRVKFSRKCLYFNF